MSILTPAPEVLDLRDQAELETLLGHLEADLPGWSWRATDALALLTRWSVLGAFASPSNRLVAFLAYRPSGDVLEIGALATLPEVRGRGLVSALFKSLKSRRGFQGQEIWLEVSSANDSAQRAYHSLGFRVVGTRPSYYRDGSAALLMTLGE